MKQQLDHRISSLKLGNLEDLEIRDKIKIYGINQDLPEEEYNLSNYKFIRKYEKQENKKFKVTVPSDKNKKRYVLIERTK